MLQPLAYLIVTASCLLNVFILIITGIKARFQGKEYVITQPTDIRMQEDAVYSVLRAEYALLCMGASFKAEFDRYALDRGTTTIPRK